MPKTKLQVSLNMGQQKVPLKKGAGEGGQVVDVLMGVDEAALHHIVVSLLFIL